jgi:hypothetical protein
MSCAFCSNVISKAGHLETTVAGARVKCIVGCHFSPLTKESATNFKNNGGRFSDICHNNPFRSIYNRKCNPKPSHRR